MRIDHIADRDAFLVEDLILTLTNFRGVLGWIVDEGTPEDMRRIGVARLDRQLALLAERAEQLRRHDVLVPVDEAWPQTDDTGAADQPAPGACSDGDKAVEPPTLAAEAAELAAMIGVLDTWLSERPGTGPGARDCAPEEGTATGESGSDGLANVGLANHTQAGAGLASWLEELSDDGTPVLESDASGDPLGAMIFRTRRTDLEL